MAQEKNKLKPDLYEKGGGGNDKRRGPRFSIYWIYAFVAIILIAYNVLNYGYADVQTVTEQEFKENMLKQGDVAKIDKVRNKELVRIYIKPASLNKDYYRQKFTKQL